MKRFYNTSLEEQETIINVDYYAKSINVYTCKKVVYERLQQKLGQPTKTYYTQGQICGASWNIPFSEKRKLTSALSRPLIIGQMK